MSTNSDLQVVLKALPALPARQSVPLFIVLSGLPGTGKTYLSRLLEERLPLVAVRTDEVRKLLVLTPTYQMEESARVYQVCELVIQKLLWRGISVIFDATNLSEQGRRDLYAIGDISGARMEIIKVEAPEAVVRQRLTRRSDRREAWDRSDATWEIYERMKSSVEPIQRRHRVIDTSQDLQSSVERLVTDLAKGWEEED